MAVGGSFEHHDALMDPPDLIAGDDESDGEGVDVGRARLKLSIFF